MPEHPPSQPRRLLRLASDTQPHRVSNRGRPPDEELTHRLLVAALTLIDDLGYTGVSPEAVTRRAGVSKGVFYARWSSCEELVAQALRVHSPVARIADTGSLRGDLVDLLRPWTRPVDRNERICGHLLGPARNNPGLQTALQEAVVSPLTQAIATISGRHAARGQAVYLSGQRLLARIVVAMWWERSLAQPDPWPTTELDRVVTAALLPILDAPPPR